jgi:stress response protein SCP2
MSLEKGESGPLNVTKEAKHRIFVGLGWDPNEKTGLLDQAKALVKGQELHHDLDLSAYMFDVNNRYIGHVSAETGRHVDQTGQIYHSGDNVEGIGDGDDEQISVELKGLDETIHCILFKASIKSGHVFGDIKDPEIRIGDGYSGHTFAHHNLTSEGGAKKSAYIFLKITRADEENWNMHHIDAYLDMVAPEDWVDTLKAYLAA